MVEAGGPGTDDWEKRQPALTCSRKAADSAVSASYGSLAGRRTQRTAEPAEPEPSGTRPEPTNPVEPYLPVSNTCATARASACEMVRNERRTPIAAARAAAAP